MAYVRRRGAQLAIVRGVRDRKSGKVEQQILFTLYSKDEARAAIGRGDAQEARRFEALLEDQYPDVGFSWKRIRAGISAHLDVLPEHYEYRAERLHGRFRADLCAFTRQLILCEPQALMSAAKVIEAHRRELEYLKHLITWRLKLREQKDNQWNRDNAFYWRFALRGSLPPPEAEEHAAGLYERGEYEAARAVFRLLVDCFDNYADGHNFLGLIALEERRLDDALAHFEKTIEVGRLLFPRRIARSRYWSDLATRPYMRGLRNLTLTLIQAERFDAALPLCARLEEECGDGETAEWDRAAIFLNTERWREAADIARRLAGAGADGSLLLAFALFELDQRHEAVGAFLHFALNHPLAARILLDERTRSPRGCGEALDRNAGLALSRLLPTYRRRRPARRFFRALLRDARVSRLLEEIGEVEERRRRQHPMGEREAFDRMMLMRAPQFARAEATRLRDLVERPRQVH